MTKVRWGLIGCGDISRKRIAPALRDSAVSEFVAVCRSRAELAESFAREFGAKKWYPTWQDLLRDDEIDAVYIATPVHLHASQTIAAAAAGKHVLCEKPLAMSVEECDQMMAACRAGNAKFGTAYYRHFYPVIKRIKSVIAAGEIGTPILAQINAFENFDPPADHPRAWLLKKSLAGGGPMFDFGCHRIEVLINLLGAVTDVRAMNANVAYDREVEDTAMALFRFDGGACGVLSVTHAAQEPQDTIDIFGSLGSIRVPVLNEGHMRVVTREGERRESHPPAANLHAPLIEDFADAVLTGREPLVNGEIGRAVALVEERIYA
jgi:predicted dehydrogenase